MTDHDAVRDLTCDEVRELAGAFVLGALEPADEAAVRAHLASCSDAHEEIAELGGVLPVLAESVPVVAPSDGLKARIMAAAAADLAAREAPAVVPAVVPVVPVAAVAVAAVADPGVTDAAVQAAQPVEPAPTAEPTEPDAPVAFPTAEARAARRQGGASIGTWIVRIAAVLAIIGLAGWNLLLRNEISASTAYEQSVAQVLAVAGQPGSLTAILSAADGSSGTGLAAVSASGAVTIAMQDLAPTSGNAVYTAWAIGSDTVPVALGDFTVGRGGTGTLAATGPPTAQGVVVAITLEPLPGATAPAGPVVSKGVASAPG